MSLDLLQVTIDNVLKSPLKLILFIKVKSNVYYVEYVILIALIQIMLNLRILDVR